MSNENPPSLRGLWVGTRTSVTAAAPSASRPPSRASPRLAYRVPVLVTSFDAIMKPVPSVPDRESLSRRCRYIPGLSSRTEQQAPSFVPPPSPARPGTLRRSTPATRRRGILQPVFHPRPAQFGRHERGGCVAAKLRRCDGFKRPQVGGGDRDTGPGTGLQDARLIVRPGGRLAVLAAAVLGGGGARVCIPNGRRYVPRPPSKWRDS